MTEKKICPIDGGEMKPVFSAELLNKYPVEYFACDTCLFLQTEAPYWLEEAYGEAIADCDTGIMERNLHNVLRVSSVLKLLGVEREEVIDVAGGYGILTRLLRDVGFDCYWSDKYCQNIFSKGFCASEGQAAAALCALEVLEHIENPLEFLRSMIAQHGARAIVFSTEDFKTVPDRDWRYYSFDTGQHISFYSRRSLNALARKLGWFYIPLPRHLHLFTARPVKGLRAVVLRSYLLYLHALWTVLRMRRYSRTQADSKRLAVEKGGIS